MKCGDSLHNLLSSLGFQITEHCECLTHIKQMNEKGPQWCKQHVHIIVGGLKKEALNRKLPTGKIAEFTMRQVVLLALRNCE